MLADLHAHSTASDGLLSPEALVAAAHAAGVQLFALTDHDTLAGQQRAQAEAKRLGMGYVTGVEVSAQWRGRSVHILGLNIALDSPELCQLLAEQALVRERRAQVIGERLAKAGWPGAYDAAKTYAGSADIARPHFARHLIAVGAVKDMDQAFKRFLGEGKLGDVKAIWPDVHQSVSAIVAAGGRAVLAHPLKYDLTRRKLIELLRVFQTAGGQGMEVVSGYQAPPATAQMAGLCRELGLLASCGSDFHAPQAPWQALGAFGTLAADLTPVWHDWVDSTSVTCPA